MGGGEGLTLRSCHYSSRQPLFYIIPPYLARAFLARIVKITKYFLNVHTQFAVDSVLNVHVHFLCLRHRQETSPAQNIDLSSSPDGLAAFGTHNLSGGAGPLSAAGCSRLGCPRGPDPHGRGEGVAAQQNFIPALV